jgi:hypothetical protein
MFNKAVLLVAIFTRFQVDADDCRVYLGPSSLSTEDEPKLGLYAGVDYAENETVGYPEIGIPLVDFTEIWNRHDSVANSIMEFLEGFLWTAEFAGAKWEGNFSVTVAIPGFGTLANYHAGTHNIDWLQGAVLLRDKGPEFQTGKSHPSRGAISNYHNLTMRAVKPIVKGMELFANFGDVWDGNKAPDIYGDKLTRWDYKDADKVLDKILEFMNKYQHQMDDKQRDDVLDFILVKILGTAAGSHAKVIRSLIPAHPGKLQAVKDMGGTFQYRNPDLVRSQKWLDKHAVCVDNIVSKPSTIPEAGRGAFATRFLKKGSIVAPVPMIHIPNDDLTFMYDLTEKSVPNGKVNVTYDLNKPRGQQLIVNYCFAHPESSLLLFPISPTLTQVNHAPPEKANARLTWSKNRYWGNAFDLHDMTPRKLADYHHIGITMELYALRDINQGEEIFIDYGRDWEAAWKEHMKSYQESEWPIKAEDLKGEYKEKPFKTKTELEKDPYPAGVQTACFVVTNEMTDGRRKVNDDGNEIALWANPVTFEKYTGADFYLCDVIDRKASEGFFYNYTIWGVHNDVVTEVLDVPHAAITFVDGPYTSDIHSRESFRHPIGIPDVIFPQAWRDRRN